MGIYLTESTLKDLGRQQGRGAREELLKSASAGSEDVFLSHSSKDRDLVAGAIRWLRQQGVTVYIDKMDPELPKVTSSATASRLRTKIRGCKNFLLLATNNAINSRWVPWELGLADGIRGTSRVAILPVEDSSGRWDGAEYINLYRRIAPTEGGSWRVFGAGQRTGGIMLENALG